MGDEKMSKAVYPWEDCDGLSPVLHDKLLWQGVVAGLDEEFARFVSESLKDSARSASIYRRRQSRPARQQDRFIAEALCDVLANAKARRTFANAFSRGVGGTSFQEFFANRLYQHVENTLGSGCPEFVPDLCDERKPAKWFLNPEKLRGWLSGQSSSDAQRLRMIALCTAAFAILQPEDGATLRDVLIRYDERFEPLIDPAEVSQASIVAARDVPAAESEIPRGAAAGSNEKNTTDAESVTASRQDASLASQPKPADPTAVSSSSAVDGLVGSLAIAPYDPETQAEGAVRDVIALLRRVQVALDQRLKPFEEAIDEVDRIRDDTEQRLGRVREALREVGNEFHLDVRPPQPNAPIQQMLDEWSSLGAAAARILEGVGQLTYLERQCGVVQPIVLPESGPLPVVAAAIDRAVEAVEAKWDTIRSRLRNVGAFLELVCGGDVDAIGRAAIESRSDESLWGDLLDTVLTTDGRSAAAEKARQLFDATELRGAVLAVALAAVPEHAERTLDRAFAQRGHEFDIEAACRLFQFVDPSQFLRIAHSCPSCSEHVAALVALSAVASPTEQRLGHLETFARSPTVPEQCRHVMEALHEDLQAGHASWETLTRKDSGGGRDRVTVQKENVLALIGSGPGQKGKYHSLLVSAHAHFIKDLGPIIEGGAFEEAVSEWHQTDISSMVDIAERADQGHGRDAQNSHRRKLRQYLQNFGGELERLARLAREVQDPVQARLPAVASGLRGATAEGSRTLIDALRDGRLASAEWRHRLVALGADISWDQRGAVLLDAEFEAFRPGMLLSWPIVSEGQDVPLEMYVIDSLRAFFRVADSDDVAVSNYLRHGKFREAVRGVEYAPSRRHDVERVVSERKEELRTRWKDTLAQGIAMRGHHAAIDAGVRLFEEECEKLEFEGAETAALLLQDELREWEVRENPIRRAFAVLLEEAGQTVRGESDEGQLRAQWQKYKQTPAVAARRRHLAIIERLAAQDGVAGQAAVVLDEVVPALDRAARWLEATESARLAASLEVVCNFMSARYEFAQGPVAGDVLLQRVRAWIPAQVSVACGESAAARGAAIAAIDEVARKMRTPGVPDGYLLRLIGKVDVTDAGGEGAASRREEEGTAPVHVAIDTSPPARLDSVPVDRADDIPDFIREQVARDAKDAPKEAAESLARVKSAVRSGNWRLARAVFSAAYLEPPSEADFDASFVLDAYAVALAVSTSPTEAQLFNKVSLFAGLRFAGADYEQMRLFFPREWVDGLMAWMLASAARQAELVELKTTPATAAETLASFVDPGEAESPAGRWLRELLTKVGLHARQGGLASIALSLWNSVTGIEKPARPRHGLLAFLYRNRHDRALKDLAEKVVKDTTVRSLIIACLDSFRRSESDLDSYLQARHRYDAFRRHSLGVRNNSPWFELFASLLLEREDTARQHTLQWELESAAIGFLGEGRDGVIEVRFIPPPFDPVRGLKLYFGEEKEGHDLLDGDLLIEERVMSITVPRHSIRSAGDVSRIAFRLRGDTVCERPVDVRGSWDLPNSMQTLTPLNLDLIARTWPGASGKTVTENQGYYGRERERDVIEQALHAEVRAKSVMVFGERRIGKTSLLHECVRRMPSSTRGIYGLFLDVSDLQFGDDTGAMAQALFDTVVGAIFAGGVDGGDHIRRRLIDAHATQSVAEIKADLMSGIDARQSFSHALQELAIRLEVKSGGEVQRLCVVIDEFDRFVEPYLAGRQVEVERLMWGLRNIVMNCRNVGLILAGSGLVNVFTESYGQALWGSIEKVEISKFDSVKDRSAIEETLLPQEIRPRLCDDPALFGQVVDRAVELTAGHPYYLAMLGYSAATASRGHRFTPALLNRVTDLMMRKRISHNIEPQKFFAHSFETLMRLPERMQAIAKIIVAHIAESTTSEFPYLQVTDALRVPELDDASVPTRERQRAYTALISEQMIVEDGVHGRVSIRVPLTAAALRFQGPQLRREARIMLEGNTEASV